jgi:ribosome maturation factor RimP
MQMELKEKIKSLIEPVLSQHNMELVDLNAGNYRNKTLLRFFIDKKEGKITLNDCQKMSDIIGGVLDMEQAVTGAYVLEVSSPGVYRPLTKPEHFKRFAGENVKIELKHPLGAQHNFAGIIVSSDDKGFTLNDGSKKHTFEYANIKKARLNPEVKF